MYSINFWVWLRSCVWGRAGATLEFDLLLIKDQGIERLLK